MASTLEKDAFLGKPLPAGVSLPDSYLFLCLRSLYAAHRRDAISIEDAEREKKDIMQFYDKLKFSSELYDRVPALFNRIEVAATAVRKDSELIANEKISALLNAIYGV